MNVVQLSGEGNNPVFASTTYNGAIEVNQTVKLMVPMTEGLAVRVQANDSEDSTTGQFGYLDTSGSFSSVDTSVGAPFGSFGLAPNGDVYYSDSGLLYRLVSWRSRDLGRHQCV